MRHFKKLHGLLLALSAILFMGLLSSAYGQPSVIRPGCDDQVMDAMEAKSWMHAQRRIVQQKNIIGKPDSVLEYSCFNQHVGHVAANPARRFSEETAYWGPISVTYEFALDLALFETVTLPLISYLQGSFMHTYIGGRVPPLVGPPPVYGVYDCNAMQSVWEAARCNQFCDCDQMDGFYDFPWYANNDPRVFPTIWPACSPDSRYADAFENTYAATGDGNGQDDGRQAFYALMIENMPVPSIDGIDYEEDPIDPLLEMIPGPEDTIDCAASPVIPTGITVAVPGEASYTEHVCVVPSCSYYGGACGLDN